MPRDKHYYAAFARYVFLTVQQAHGILDIPFDSVNYRLRRLEETGYLGRVQLNAFEPYLYFLKFKGAEEAVRLGVMEHPWCIQKKSPSQIKHDIGITEIQWRLEANIPDMKARRWKTDLAKDFTGDLPDLVTDFQDGLGECPWEYVRTNPVSTEKLMDYAGDFKRAYIVLPTLERIERLFTKLQDSPIPNMERLWFAAEEQFMQDPMGKIFWQPKNHERSYSILKPSDS